MFDKISYLGATNRGLSGNVWAACPISRLLEDPAEGSIVFDDFLAAPAGAGSSESAITSTAGVWRFYLPQGTGNTIDDEAVEHGSLLITAAGAAGGGGTICAGRMAKVLPTQSDAAFFESRFRVSTVDNGISDVFLGLSGLTTLGLLFSGQATFANVNLLGFARLGSSGNGSKLFLAYRRAGQTAQTVDLGVTLAADVWIKAGLAFLPSQRRVQVYVDNALRHTLSWPSVEADTWPNAVLRPTVSIRSVGNTSSTVSVDWIAAALATL